MLYEPSPAPDTLKPAEPRGPLQIRLQLKENKEELHCICIFVILLCISVSHPGGCVVL